jgi:predicted acylesterase/phospholipase RssA
MLEMRFLLPVLLCFSLSSAFAQTTPKVGVTMAGGVARGFAYLGALQELVERGMPLDLIVGTSAGAMVSGLYASGYSFDAIADIFSELQNHQTDLARVTFPPTKGLLDIRGLETVYRALVNNQQLENTSPQLAIMVTKLEVSPPIALTKGDLTTAMRASISLPIVFPAVEIDGHYYADGGLKNPIPVDVARDLGSSVVISIRGLAEPNVKPDNLISSLGLTVAAVTLPVNQAQPDLYLRVKAYDAQYFDFGSARELIKRGRETASENWLEIAKILQQKNIKLNPPGDPHAKNSVNQVWRSRLEQGLNLARAIPAELTIAPQLELGPSAFDWGTRVGAPSAWGSLGLGLEATGGVLGNFGIAAGYVKLLNAPESSGYAKLEYRFSSNLRVYGSFDPARRPANTSWELGLEFQDSDFGVKLSLDSQAIGLTGTARTQLGDFKFSSSLELRFGENLNPRIESQIAFKWQILGSPWFTRARALIGYASNTQGFALGSSSLLRAYPEAYLTRPSVLIANLEFGYRFQIPNLAGIASLEPEIRIFTDFGWDFNSSYLFDAGIGLNLPGRWFGFLPFNLGIDLAFGSVGARVTVFTVLGLP